MPGPWLGTRDDHNKMLWLLPHRVLWLVGNRNSNRGMEGEMVTGNWFRWGVAKSSLRRWQVPWEPEGWKGMHVKREWGEVD